MYAIKNYKYGSYTTNLIALEDTFKADRAEEYEIIEAVTKNKGKQVVMPNGRKAALYTVNGETWARYKDGFCEIIAK
ncbi:hypothetical protein BOW89_gp093 [Escherichia phage WG01]|uniref:Uncharacterized protein n=1 Tax=Escherichia phage WG01 TaxID=1837931 RepID=A0A172Q138_9CAUD|nr:hypothetical protein BOW89_gp093 [Escherichia phage WG01]QAY00121.1 hypothetical protein EcWhh1_191 [Escherichia phage EcWhh-1]QPI13402.1 hypothetical protein [Salmonella phage vB_SalM_ABTNLsp5]QXV72451.1 hypothetical protein PSD9_166 [Shigella phage PSD9]CAI9865947.1 hypothetical protein PFGHJN_00189 [Escherichia phage UP19]AND75765.1 hypothetical protein WG01_93 [Escherichia phage WG01]